MDIPETEESEQWQRFLGEVRQLWEGIKWEGINTKQGPPFHHNRQVAAYAAWLKFIDTHPIKVN